MKPSLATALIILLLLGLGGTCWRLGQSDAQHKADKATYHRTTDSLTIQLAGAHHRVDTLLQRVPVERVRLLHDSARVDTVRLAFHADTTTEDSLRTAVQVIAAQDTLIRAQSGHIRTLTAIIAADSGVARLFHVQRLTDSTRIHQLEHQTRGFRPLGLHLPTLHCTAGPVVIAYPKPTVGLGGGCGLGF